jgi:hypothetical protein
VIKDPKKLHVRVFSFKTHRDANYGGLNVQRNIKFMHKERNIQGANFFP